MQTRSNEQVIREHIHNEAVSNMVIQRMQEKTQDRPKQARPKSGGLKYLSKVASSVQRKENNNFISRVCKVQLDEDYMRLEKDYERFEKDLSHKSEVKTEYFNNNPSKPPDIANQGDNLFIQ